MQQELSKRYYPHHSQVCASSGPETGPTVVNTARMEVLPQPLNCNDNPLMGCLWCTDIALDLRHTMISVVAFPSPFRRYTGLQRTRRSSLGSSSPPAPLVIRRPRENRRSSILTSFKVKTAPERNDRVLEPASQGAQSSREVSWLPDLIRRP